MTRPWFLNLLLAAAVLAALVKLAGTVTSELPPLPPPPKVPARDFRATAPPPPVPAGESYDEIAARNLFSPERGRPEPRSEEPAAAEPPPAVQPPRATLFGVLIDDEGRKFAFLVDESQGASEKPKRYGEGDGFGGGRVKAIHPDKVVLEVGGREHTVSLRAPKKGIELPRQLMSQPPSPAAAPVPGVIPQQRVRRPVLRRPTVPAGDREAAPPSFRRRTSRPPRVPPGFPPGDAEADVYPSEFDEDAGLAEDPWGEQGLDPMEEDYPPEEGDYGW